MKIVLVHKYHGQLSVSLHPASTALLHASWGIKSAVPGSRLEDGTHRAELLTPPRKLGVR